MFYNLRLSNYKTGNKTESFNLETSRVMFVKDQTFLKVPIAYR